MTTNLAEARSLARRDRRPSRNRDRDDGDRPSVRERSSRSLRNAEDVNQRLEERRARYRTQNPESSPDNEKDSNIRRSTWRRSKSSSTDDDDSIGKCRTNARKSCDLDDSRRQERRRGSRRHDSTHSGDEVPSSNRASHGELTDLSRSGRRKDSDRLQSSPRSEKSKSGVSSRRDSRTQRRTEDTQQLKLDQQSRRESSRHRRELRERPRHQEEPRSKSVIQSSQCLIDSDREDPLANVAATVLQAEQDNAKKIANEEQARKIAEKAAIRERRRLDRERLERERERDAVEQAAAVEKAANALKTAAAEKAAAVERAIAAEKCAAAEKVATAEQIATRRAAAELERVTALEAERAAEAQVKSVNQASNRTRAVSVNETSERVAEADVGERDLSRGKSRNSFHKKPTDGAIRDEDPARAAQTPRRTLVVRDATIPVDANVDDRVILVSGIDDEGAKAKKPSDYKREASAGLSRKKSISAQATIEISSPRQSSSAHRAGKAEKTNSSSPFRPCPGFAGVEGSNELMKALAFRRQKTMGTEKAYHATGNNSSLLVDDRVVKTGSIDTDGDDDDDESLSEGGPDR